MSDAAGKTGGGRHAPDAPGTTIHASPAGMTLTIPSGHEEGNLVGIPETVHEDSTQGEEEEPKKEALPPQLTANIPQKHFRQQFDELMKRLEDRFQAERVELEEKHSKELEEAMGYFSLDSDEREAKQQELQVSLLEDIGSMAKQLHDLTGALGPNDDLENVTLPSDPQVLEQYANRMQTLEEQFQKEKFDLERKHAAEMEQALGTLKLSREERDIKQQELQDQLSAEIGDMAKQLEELNRAKHDYEAKMAYLKQQLTEKDKQKAPEGPNLDVMSRVLRQVERERDAANDELRRLKLALQVTHGNVDTVRQSDFTGKGSPIVTQHVSGIAEDYGLSPKERENVASLRGRIEQVERDLKLAAKTPGGSEKMRHLRERMEFIEKDLMAAEESTKEQYALDNIRTRMEKVERLLAEGEKAAQDWEALEDLRDKIGRVDNDLHAVEEAKKEYEALQTLRSKMEEVEAELKAAEQLASNRENVERLRARLGQVERELGVAQPTKEDQSSIDKLLSRLNKAESSLEEARRSTPKLRNTYGSRPAVRSALDPGVSEQDDEVENILERLAQAERKLKAAKESAQRQDPKVFGHVGTAPFDGHQSKIRARLQNHFDETDHDRQTPQSDNRSETLGRSRGGLYKEYPRAGLGSFSRDEYSVPDVPPSKEKLDLKPIPGESEKDVSRLEEKLGTELHGGAPRPLRRRRGGLPDDHRLRPSKSMPFSSARESGNRYVSELHELRKQRAQLSEKMPKKSGFEEEKKEEADRKQPEPKYSFKEAIRNEERQRLKNKIQPKSPAKSKSKMSEPLQTGGPPLTTVFASRRDASKGDPPSEAKSIGSHEDAPGEKQSGTEAKFKVEKQSSERHSIDPPDSEAEEKPSETPTDELSLDVKQPVDVDGKEDESLNSSAPPSIHPETVKQVSVASPPVLKMPEPIPEDTEAARSRAQSTAVQPPVVRQRTVVNSREVQRERREKDRTVRFFVVLLFLVVVILAVVIVVVVFFFGDDDDSNSPRATIEPVPTFTPTIGPTTPTLPPSTMPPGTPTLRPTQGSFPPAVFTGCPELADDRPLLLDGVTRERSTAGSMYDASRMGACGPIDDVGDDGVWYVFVGSGELVQMHTCTLFNPSFDTQLLVYSQVRPELGCRQGLSCVAANDDFCGLQSSVSFLAERGRLYFVYVNGRTANPIAGTSASEGEFSLTLATTPEGSCQSAIGPLEIQPNNGQLPVIRQGELMGGTFGVDPCNPDLATRTGEVWYKVTGNGQTVVASTCHSISNFPARLAVYTGSCDNLVCETAEDSDCGNGSSITWATEAGQEYYLLVYSPSFVPDIEFGLTVREFA